MKTVVLINAHSRKARHLLDQIQQDFSVAENPFNIIDLIIVRRKKDFPRVFERIQNNKEMECLIIGSGDGTITSCINQLRGRDITYGIIPLGTCNTFACNLGLPLDYEEAVAVIKRKNPTSVALGEANGKLFTCNAAIGVSGRVAENISDKTKRYLGQLGYVMSGFKELMRHDAFECVLHIGESTKVFKTHQLLIANGRYHGQVPISTAASVFKDQLVLVAFGTGVSRWRHLASMARFALGRHVFDDDTMILPFTNGTLETKPLRNIELDGEPASATPLEIRVVPNAVNVLT